MSYVTEKAVAMTTPVEQLLAELEAEYYWVRCDTMPDGRARVRIERHSGRTFHDYRSTTTSAAGMATAVRRAYLKVQEADRAGEIEPVRKERAAEWLQRVKGGEPCPST